MTAPHVADSTFRTWPQDDFLLPPPNPAQRMDAPLATSDAPTVPYLPALDVESLPAATTATTATTATAACATPSPAPSARSVAASVLDPRDLRRLELNAALTAAGIAPLPGDREAIDQLSALPHSVHEALHRWLTS